MYCFPGLGACGGQGEASGTRGMRAEQGQTVILNNDKTKLLLVCISHTKKNSKNRKAFSV